jgi:hypothetical protein
MIRIADIIAYLNSFRTNPEQDSRQAFGFMDFMNQSSSLIDAINMLAETFGLSLEEENKSCEIFNKAGKDNQGSDKLYFEYLRSLCSIHPLDTSRHKRYMHENAKFECCPFVVWNNSTFMGGDADIIAKIYTNSEDSTNTKESIYLPQVVKYVRHRYQLLENIKKQAAKLVEERKQELRNIPIPEQRSSESFNQYLTRLENESVQRYQSNQQYRWDFIKMIMSSAMTNSNNDQVFAQYKKAWKIAVEFERNSLQCMKRKGLSCSGISDGSEGELGTLFDRLYYPRYGIKKYTYELGKVLNLDPQSANYSPCNRAWGREKLADMLPFLQQYVAIDIDNTSDKELFILTNIALFEHALKTGIIVIPMNADT